MFGVLQLKLDVILLCFKKLHYDQLIREKKKKINLDILTMPAPVIKYALMFRRGRKKKSLSIITGMVNFFLEWFILFCIFSW